MALPKQKFREIVFQLLYSYDLGKSSEEDIVPLMMKELSVTKRSVKEAFTRMQDISSKIPEIDALIANTSSGYRFERIPTVERNILRLGIYELLFDDEIPPKVAITEAMRLAKKFSTPESATYINALLDALYQKDQGQHIDAEKLKHTAEELMKSEEEIQEVIKKLEDQPDE